MKKQDKNNSKTRKEFYSYLIERNFNNLQKSSSSSSSEIEDYDDGVLSGLSCLLISTPSSRY
ncbi:MAG: hypothetical protein JXA54_07485 [Candidatus Heimdallarchaeota archaeon]|nr:hypothetical protein [Candidatus Heimdallarchaeota archaeon]